MKIKLHPHVEEMRGAFGEVVYRKVRGKIFASHKATPTINATDDQLSHRTRFKKAVEYGKSALANASVRVLYEEAAKRRNVPVFSVTIADYFNAPVIYEIDLSSYNGHIGSSIKINAMDDFSLKNVHVSISNSQSGMPLENGDAVKATDGTDLWVYAPKFNVAADTLVKVQVVATDLPGGTAVEEVTKQL